MLSDCGSATTGIWAEARGRIQVDRQSAADKVKSLNFTATLPGTTYGLDWHEGGAR